MIQVDYWMKTSYQKKTSYAHGNVVRHIVQTAHKYQRINTNGRKSFTLNTGWVGEDYDTIMEQMLMSERVMLDGLPVNVTTNSLNLQKSVNDKMINYIIEVEEAFDTRYV